MNQSKTGKFVLRLCVTAMMAALVFLGSKLEIQIPSILGFTRFHLGNIMCALSGILLGPWWGGLAAGLGSMFYDLTSPAFASEFLVTFISKGLYGLVAGVFFVYIFKKRESYVPMLVSTFAGAVYYIIFYLGKTYFYKGLFLGGLTPSAAWVATVAKMPSSFFNGAVAIIIAPLLGLAIRKALRAAHLERAVV